MLDSSLIWVGSTDGNARNDGPRRPDRPACPVAATRRSRRLCRVSRLAARDRARWARLDPGPGDSVHARPAAVVRASADREAAAASTAHGLGPSAGVVGRDVRGACESRPADVGRVAWTQRFRAGPGRSAARPELAGSGADEDRAGADDDRAGA